jgi:hypothetical protein
VNAVPLTDAVRYYAPHVQAAGLYLWGDNERTFRLVVGTRDGRVRTEVAHGWGYGDERATFAILADRLARYEARL